MKLTAADSWAVQQFKNFLGWGAKPGAVRLPAIPPAVWAYCFGVTENCPPKGEM